jgi:hypothetical protein
VFARLTAKAPVASGTGTQTTKVVLKKKRVIEPAKLVHSPDREPQADGDGFLDVLRGALERAINDSERVEIR